MFLEADLGEHKYCPFISWEIKMQRKAVMQISGHVSHQGGTTGSGFECISNFILISDCVG
jgi:hypothetical protein